MESPDCVGFLRYEGKIVEDGILDARSAAKALLGFDSSMRYFINQERPDIAAIDFPIPVKVQQGSWEALIPQTVEGWILTAAGIAGTQYLTKAAGKLAENDFKDIGLKNLFRKALKGLQWLVRVGKHLGHLDIRSVTGLRWDQPDQCGIPNAAGNVLYLPQDVMKQLVNCPPKLLGNLASVVEVERALILGVEENGKLETVQVTRQERYIFFEETDASEVLFPELAHGMIVNLGGLVTRGNEMSNTIGFQYNGHILTCTPRIGNIVRFKKHLFLACEIHGEITRADNGGNPTETRPKIIFEDLTITSDTEQPPLPFTGNDPSDE